MPSVIASISEEEDELLSEMVGSGRAESREEAAGILISWAAYKKHGIE